LSKLHIMLDLETLGKKVMAPVVQIGAACAAESLVDGHWQVTPFFFDQTIALDSAMEQRKPDASTILWWMRQNEEVRAQVLVENGQGVRDTLRDFSLFISETARIVDAEEVYVWGNGASSDNAWLISLYEQYGMAVPWEYWGNMCYRTIKNFNRHIPRPELPEHLKHNALADARSQLFHLVAIMNSKEKL
jgi:exodeoxyribonuclease VIII